MKTLYSDRKIGNVFETLPIKNMVRGEGIGNVFNPS